MKGGSCIFFIMSGCKLSPMSFVEQVILEPTDKKRRQLPSGVHCFQIDFEVCDFFLFFFCT